MMRKWRIDVFKFKCDKCGKIDHTHSTYQVVDHKTILDGEQVDVIDYSKLGDCRKEAEMLFPADWEIIQDGLAPYGEVKAIFCSEKCMLEYMEEKHEEEEQKQEEIVMDVGVCLCGQIEGVEKCIYCLKKESGEEL